MGHVHPAPALLMGIRTQPQGHASARPVSLQHCRAHQSEHGADLRVERDHRGQVDAVMDAVVTQGSGVLHGQDGFPGGKTGGARGRRL